MSSKFMVNAHLNGNEFILKQNNPTCILLTHGFTATPVEVKPIAERFFRAGYDVYAPLLPGHNTTPDDLNKQSYSDWTNHLETILKTLLEEYDQVFVSGESMGGLLSCYLAENHPEIKGLILFAPALSIKNLEFSRFIRFVKPYIGTVEQNPDPNQEEEDEYPLPWKGYKVKPTKAGFELFKLQKLVKRNLSKINQPTLIFQGILDETIRVESSAIVNDNISSAIKELIYLENTRHCILLDVELDEVAEKSITFLNTHSNNHGN